MWVNEIKYMSLPDFFSIWFTKFRVVSGLKKISQAFVSTLRNQGPRRNANDNFLSFYATIDSLSQVQQGD